MEKIKMISTQWTYINATQTIKWVDYQPKVKKKPLTRICLWCKTTVTPEWRKGPEKKDLCNRCGLRYQRQIRIQNKMSIESILNPCSPSTWFPKTNLVDLGEKQVAGFMNGGEGDY